MQAKWHHPLTSAWQLASRLLPQRVQGVTVVEAGGAIVQPDAAMMASLLSVLLQAVDR